MNKEKLKVCVLLPVHWSFNIGGAEFQAKCIVERLAADDNVEVYYLARKTDKKYKPKNYTLVNINSLAYLSKYGYFLDAFKLLRWLYKIRPDVIYQRVGCAYTGIAALYSRIKKIKMIWHISSIMDVQQNKICLMKPHHFFESILFRFGVRNAGFIIAQTKEQSDSLSRFLGRPADAIIRNFHPLPDKTNFEKDKPLKIIWVANIKQNKNPELFINLAYDLGRNYPSVQFIMIGGPAYYDPEYQDIIEKRINEVQNLSYLGKKSIEEVNQILESSHLLINTSTFEGFPNTFIQAWSRKVPVISLNANPDNIFFTQKIGYCATDYYDMVKLTERLITNEEERKEMGNNAYHHSIHNYSFKNLDKLIAFIDQ